jgi:hypothetical protein
MRVAQLTLEKMQEETSWVRFQDTGRTVLEAAMMADAESVFGVVSGALLDGKAKRFRLLLALEHWYGDLVPPDTLVKWASAHPSARSFVVRLIKLDGGSMPERLSALLKAFPEDKELLHSALASLGTGSWWGPYSARLQKERDILRNWADESDPWIRRWAHNTIRRFDKSIDKQLKIEEEQGLSQLVGVGPPGT